MPHRTPVVFPLEALTTEVYVQSAYLIVGFISVLPLVFGELKTLDDILQPYSSLFVVFIYWQYFQHKKTFNGT